MTSSNKYPNMSFHTEEVHRILSATVVSVKNEARTMLAEDPDLVRAKLDVLTQVATSFGIELDIPKQSKIRELFAWVMGGGAL